MSGSTYHLTCSRCGTTGIVNIYDDEWKDRLEIDQTNLICVECDKSENPEDWHDYRCIKCTRWFNDRAGSMASAPNTQHRITTARGPLCISCAEVILQALPDPL